MTPRWYAPVSVAHAVELLQREGVHAIAGGVGLITRMNLGVLAPAGLVSLAGVPGLRGTVRGDEGLDIGALSTLSELAADPLLQADTPHLATAFARVGNIRVRNAATVGGNLAQCEPAYDPPVLLATLDASARVTGSGGVRHVPVARLSPGCVARNEVLTRILVPTPSRGTRYAYVKHQPGSRADTATVSVGCGIGLDAGGDVSFVRLCVGALTARVVVLDAVSRVLLGHRPGDLDALATLEATVRDSVTPTTDRLGSADYKRAVAGAVAVRAVREAGGLR